MSIPLYDYLVYDKDGHLIAVEPYENLMVAHYRRGGYNVIRAMDAVSTICFGAGAEVCHMCGCSEAAIKHFDWGCVSGPMHFMAK